MKKLWLLLIVCLICGQTKAQDFNRHEVSVSYGVLPATYVVDMFADVLATWITVGAVNYKNETNWGAVNMAYNYRLTKKLGLGLTYTYSSDKADAYLLDEKIGEQTNEYHSISPTLKCNWVNLKYVTIYSKAAYCFTFVKNDCSYDEDSTHDTDHSIQHYLQVSPFGIEVGKKLTGFTEFGFGNMGLLQMGACYKF